MKDLNSPQKILNDLVDAVDSMEQLPYEELYRKKKQIIAIRNSKKKFWYSNQEPIADIDDFFPTHKDAKHPYENHDSDYDDIFERLVRKCDDEEEFCDDGDSDIDFDDLICNAIQSTLDSKTLKSDLPEKSEVREKTVSVATNLTKSKEPPSLFECSQNLQNKVKIINCNGKLFFFNGFCYEPADKNDIIRLYRQTVDDKVNYTKSLYNIGQLEQFLRSDPLIEQCDDSANLRIAVLDNCIYDVEKQKAFRHTPDLHVFSYVNASLISNPRCPCFDQFLEDATLNNPVLIERIWSITVLTSLYGNRQDISEMLRKFMMKRRYSMKLPNGSGCVYKMSRKRRKPFAVLKTIGWEIDEETGKLKQKRVTIGYAKTRLEGMKMLNDFNESPYDLENCKKTFKEVYEDWSKEKFETISKSNVNGYQASFNACGSLHDLIFKDIKTSDLQNVIDHCGKNYPTLRKLKVLFNQLYDYAMKHDICSKDYSEYIDILKHKEKNPNKRERDRLSEEDIQKLWDSADNSCVQIILMLVYTGVRVSELLDLKKENVYLDKQYFDVVKSKTQNGIRRVPIADKILPFFRMWFESSDCKYLIHTNENEHFKYRNYYDSYWKPVIQNLGISQEITPHFCLHTCISMLAEAKVEPTIIKTIVGHSGAMTMTESVYTHLDIQTLIDAINLI